MSILKPQGRHSENSPCARAPPPEIQRTQTAWRETEASIGLSWVGTAYLDGYPALPRLLSETVRAFCNPNSPYIPLLETDHKNRNENSHKAPFFVSLDSTWVTAADRGMFLPHAYQSFP